MVCPVCAIRVLPNITKSSSVVGRLPAVLGARQATTPSFVIRAVSNEMPHASSR